MSDRLHRGRLLPINVVPMSAAPKPNLLLDALAEPAALLEPGTLGVLFANRLLLERAPEAVGALPPFAWWPGEAADAVAGEVAAPDGGGPTLLAVFRETGAALDRALRHVATAVAANVEPSEVFELVAGKARELLDVDSAGVVRYEGPTHGRVMGQAGVAMPNRRFTLLGENTAAVTARTEVVAGCMEDVVGAAGSAVRIGGDEFALLLPQMTDREAALLVELVRSAVAGASAAIEAPVTISAGICTLASARDAEVLRSLADGALYWAKAHGRDRCVRYDPAIVEELSAAERAARLERDRALSGLRALATAVDARDPSTLRHSERVSALAERIAVALGWEPSRLRHLRDAAVLHDVGKLAIPDAVLFKPGRLDPEEYEQVKAHSELGAQIVRDLLDDEQVSWVRGHHERPDGRGYPDGLAAGEIPDGAAILGVADAYDAMTVARPYSAPLLPAEALEECRRLSGAQFDADAVAALESVLAVGSEERYPSRWGPSGS
jgi:putative nucleotidyltransferase with HDIG domain